MANYFRLSALCYKFAQALGTKALPSLGCPAYAFGSRMIIILSKDFEFEAAQALPQFPEGHKCRNVHGHSFKVTISVRGPVDEASGIFYDHAAISDVMKPIIEQLDHAYLNDITGLENPTIENMSRWFWEKLQPQLMGLYEIVLHETPRARCVYRGE
jgi:6-pyruvoyltetrahydropterin/6-carboxytetrahydropterin synthase